MVFLVYRDFVYVFMAYLLTTYEELILYWNINVVLHYSKYRSGHFVKYLALSYGRQYCGDTQ